VFSEETLPWRQDPAVGEAGVVVGPVSVGLDVATPPKNSSGTLKPCCPSANGVEFVIASSSSFGAEDLAGIIANAEDLATPSGRIPCCAGQADQSRPGLQVVDLAATAPSSDQKTSPPGRLDEAVWEGRYRILPVKAWLFVRHFVKGKNILTDGVLRVPRVQLGGLTHCAW